MTADAWVILGIISAACVYAFGVQVPVPRKRRH
jgi:hypothetical protein